MLKLIIALGIVLSFFYVESSAQACGYSYAKFIVIDASGSAVRNASFEFLEKDSDNIAIHSAKPIRWSEEDGSYFFSEGMCGGHHDVRVRIDASGFEPMERIIDVPLTNAKHPLVYRIRLKKNGSDQDASFVYLSSLTGTIFDATGAVVVKAKILAVDSTGQEFETISNELGAYELSLPYNRYDSSPLFKEAKYDISAERPGFKRCQIKGFVFIPSQFGKMILDIALEIETSHEQSEHR